MWSTACWSTTSPRVRVGGEAKDHRWMRLDALPEADASTREILDVLERVRHAEHVTGRLVEEA